MTQPHDPSPPDYYARLDVRPSASAETIHEAYRQKARETHPDQNPGDPEAEKQFQRIQEAYRILRDPERREKYDATRRRRQGPMVLRIAQDSPPGCGGYLWRVFAGIAAVIVFFALEALGVWAAGTWTILLAVGAAALVASLLAALVARRFPAEATDVSLRLDEERLTMRADGRTVLRLSWTKTEAVRLSDDGWKLELDVSPATAEGLRPVPPILNAVEHHGEQSVLRFDLSDTDVSRNALVSFLRATEAISGPHFTGGRW